MSAPQAQVLAKILLMQNMVGQLPTSQVIKEFLARGLLDLPGVARAEFIDDGAALAQGPDREEWPLSVHGQRDCTLIVEVSDRQAFAPYAPFVGNLCFMVTVALEREVRHRQLEQQHHLLEAEVERRTMALRQQVAERERAEERAVAERSRAQFLLEVSELVIVELDASAHVRAINERASALLGYGPGELVGRDWIETVIPSEERLGLRDAFRTVVDRHLAMPHAFQNDIVTRSGERRTIAWKNRAEVGADGSLLGTISAGVDITARIEAERRTIAEKERLATTLRSIGDGVVTTEVTGAVVDMNEAASRLIGMTAEDARGRPLEQVYRLFDESGQTQVPIAWQSALSTGKAIASPAFVQLATRDGGMLPVSDCMSPIRDAGGNTHGLVLVFRDVSERRRLFANIVRADRLEALGVMAGGIAHDFNNLLGGVFGYMDLAEQDSTEPEVKSSLAMAKSVFARARDLTQQLLTFAKGGTPIKKIMTLGPLVRESVQFALSGSKVAFQFDLPSDLWPCDVDKNQIAQVIDNLSLNAVQAMPNGGRLSVTGRNASIAAGRGLLAPGDYVSIALTDTGDGIPAHMLDRIFDPFFTTKRTGSGLGLSTCHSIMQRHGGAIDVQSTPGAGTTFTLWFKASQHVASAEPDQDAIRHRGTGVILVMDDEDYLLGVMSHSLQRMGYEVAQAKDGESALAPWETCRASGSTVCAAFLDLTIRGGMGGREAARSLRAAGFSAPIFATSGYSEDPVMANPTSFGFTASLGKPFSLQELAAFMREWLPGKAPG
jgi:PAS domain S-box-containing protein